MNIFRQLSCILAVLFQLMLYLQAHTYAKQDVNKRLQVCLLVSMLTRAEPYRTILGTILGIGQTQSETQ